MSILQETMEALGQLVKPKSKKPKKPEKLTKQERFLQQKEESLRFYLNNKDTLKQNFLLKMKLFNFKASHVYDINGNFTRYHNFKLNCVIELNHEAILYENNIYNIRDIDEVLKQCQKDHNNEPFR